MKDFLEKLGPMEKLFLTAMLFLFTVYPGAYFYWTSIARIFIKYLGINNEETLDIIDHYIALWAIMVWLILWISNAVSRHAQWAKQPIKPLE